MLVVDRLLDQGLAQGRVILDGLVAQLLLKKGWLMLQGTAVVLVYQANWVRNVLTNDS